MSPDSDLNEDTPLRTTASGRRAEEWALVLAAEGIGAVCRHGAEGWTLSVPAGEASRAAEVLARYEAENPPKGAPGSAVARRPPAPVWPGTAPFNAALAVSVGLLVFFTSVTGPRDASVVWFARGSADAVRILAGEGWRVVTALTLHADLEHVLSNAVVGGFFLALLFRARGPGLGLLLVLLAGALGNLANAWLRSPGHVAVGASTAGFGAVGLLAGLAVAHRGEGGVRGARRWVPLAEGLGILAMFGSAAATDVWAHLFGFLAGGLLGLASGLLPPGLPGRIAQLAFAATALGLVAVSWQLALR
jgi:membrane associated rhomboid family serine protease